MKSEATTSANSSSTSSSGRDRAIEILLDQDPLGSYYRAVTAIEETIPNARACRPNLITKAALVDEAFSLSKYAIDTLQKYDEAYPAQELTPLSSVDALSRERILSHFHRTLAVPSSTSLDQAVGDTDKSSAASLSPSTAALVAALRKIYDEPKEEAKSDVCAAEERTFELRRLLKDVTSHPVMTTSSASTHKHQMENMIAHLCKKSPCFSYDDKEPVEDEYIQGLLLAILSLLISPQEEQASTKPRTPTEQKTMLQVASLLALLPVSKEEDQSGMDPEVLEYFGKAAAVTVERLEIKKARILQRLQSSHSDSAGEIEEDEEEVVADADVEENDHSRSIGSNEALQEAFEQFVSTMAHDTTGSIDYPLESLEHWVASVAQSEEAEISTGNQVADRLFVENPVDYPGLHGRTEPSSSSSSDSSDSDEDSSEVSTDDDDEVENDIAAVGTSGHDEQAASLIISHGFEISANRSRSTTIDMESPDIFLDVQETDGSVLDLSVVEPCASNVGEDRQGFSHDPTTKSTSEEDETDLPPLPTPPSQMPSWLSDSSNLENSFDPSSSTFGTIPDTQVLTHVLRHATLLMTRRRVDHRDEKDSWGILTVPEGVGSHLFPPAASTKRSYSKSKDDFILHLLVASVLYIAKKRNDSMKYVQKSIERENSLKESPTLTSQLNSSLDEDAAPLSSGEEDDPAVALAMNYVEDDIPLSSESLENKGLRRKAAAAAYDSAALLISRKKETREWKQHAYLYSECLIYSLRLLRLFLQSTLRVCSGEDEDDSDEIQARNLSSVDLKLRLPKALASKLSAALTGLMSCESHVAFRSALGKDAEPTLFSLYTESVSTWGDCVPLLHSSFSAVFDLLKNLIHSVRKGSSSGNFDSLPLDSVSFYSIKGVPSRKAEVDVHRLEVMSRRLRVWDMLDLLVLRPVPFVNHAEERMIERLSRRVSIDTPPASSVVALLRSSLENLLGATSEAQELYLALCHRFHTGIMLMDGLHVSTKIEVDDATTHLNKYQNALTGDHLRVSNNPSSLLEFDATKCADSISIVSNSVSGGIRSSVHQRASKVWGTVISTRHFGPKTGIHRWAVRLDKCERGHVFLGVATSQCSTRTYVGGDKHGWGMIGTQALWHDRRKVRGDYGSTLRSGAIIVVTLDTDAGTLSFGLWKDGSSTSSQQVDASHAALSPKGELNFTGFLEDWGIAFEGLPLDSRLFPAIGLYQRDDRVSLLSVVESSSGSASGFGTLSQTTAGEQLYPIAVLSSVENDLASRVRKFNNQLCFDGVRYATETLHFISERLNERPDHVVLASVLPSLASALCLFPPTVPILSARSAILLIPHVRRCLDICSLTYPESYCETKEIADRVSEGKWLIRTTSGVPGKHDCVGEYCVDIVHEPGLDSVEFTGSGRGTAGETKNGKIVINGTLNGDALCFVEEWFSDTDDISVESTSSSIVNARMGLGGDKFEGAYSDIKNGRHGLIAGILVETLSKTHTDGERSRRRFYASQVMLAMAHCHLSGFLCDSFDLQRVEMWHPQSFREFSESQMDSLSRVMALPLFSSCSLEIGHSSHSKVVEFLRSAYLTELPNSDLCGIKTGTLFDSVLAMFHAADDQSPAMTVDLEKVIAESDTRLVHLCGGQGSLRFLCPELYTKVRRRLLRVFLHHSGRLVEHHTSYGEHDLKGEPELQSIWRGTLKIIEDGLRKALSQGDFHMSRQSVAETTCGRFLKIIDFLLLLVPNKPQTIEAISMSVSAVFEVIVTTDDLDFLREGMSLATGRAILRLIALEEISDLLAKSPGDNSVWREVIFLAVPRLLGRGRSVTFDLFSLRKEPLECASKLDGLFSSGLSGASLQGKTRLRAVALCTYKELGTIMEDLVDRLESGLVAASDRAVASTFLSILPVFGCQYEVDEIDDFLFASKIIQSLPRILRAYRKTLHAFIAQQSVSQGLAEICKRDLCIAVLRCSSAVSYVLLFQAASFANRTNDVKITAEIISLLLNELAAILPIVEANWQVSLSAAAVQQVDEDFERWIKIKAKPSVSPSAILEKRVEPSVSCIDVVRRFGIQSITCARKTESRAWPGQCFVASSFHEILSQWLHAQNAMFLSPLILNEIANSTRWASILLKAAGVVVQDAHSSPGSISVVHLRPHAEGVLPSRFRARILRMLFQLLTAMEGDTMVVEGLFELAGVTSQIISHSPEGDDGSVSAESVSLLRRLYAYEHVSWRRCINIVVSNVTNPSCDAANIFRKKVGVLSFLAGAMKGIHIGAHVVLKSPNATALSAEHHGIASNKSQPSSSPPSSSGLSASPHHLVGNGTENIVAGLCSDEAAAGIVTSIEMKSGMCEVILFPRESDAGFDNRHFLQKRKDRRSLPIRALRTFLCDVFLAQEVPLFLDASFPAGQIFGDLLKDSLSTLLSAISMKKPQGLSGAGVEVQEVQQDITDENLLSSLDPVSPLHQESSESREKRTSLKSAIVTLSCDVLLVRACISVFSQEEALKSFMTEDSNRQTLSQILDLAWPLISETASNADFISEVRSKSLSFLSLHETRLGYLAALLHEISFRSQIVHLLPDDNLRSKVDRFQSFEAEISRRSKRSNSPSRDDTKIPSKSIPRGAEEHGREAARHSSQLQNSNSRGNISDDEDDSDAANTAVEHHREAAIAQMAELGLPRSWSEFALRRVGGIDIEAAVTFCLEYGGDMERLLAEETERASHRDSSENSGTRREGREISPANHFIRQLMEMGFPRRWCIEALAVTGNNLDEALTWILNNGERLSEEDEAMGAAEDCDGDEDEDEDEDDEEEEEVKAGDSQVLQIQASSVEQRIGWNGSVTPLRFISGRSIIDPVTLEISGLPNGGFSSVGTKGILLLSGKWYYEATLLTAGCLQIGWADGSFAGHCHAERGDGCGDGPSSWAFDGWRRYRWHSTAVEWGCRWKEGDVVGCMVDMDVKEISFTLNGEGTSVGMGLAFSGDGFRPCGGVYACVSFNRKEKLRLVLGGRGCAPFKYPPPQGYRGVGEAVFDAVRELDSILDKERVLGYPKNDTQKAFLCDFSDSEHGHELMAWGHRYYGADASVHLGAGSSKQTSTKVNSQSHHVSSANVSVSRRVESAWSNKPTSLIGNFSTKSLTASILQGYQDAEETVAFELFNECVTVAILLSRKLILHLAAGMGTCFDPACFVDDDDRSVEIFGHIWSVLEACASLRSSGWAGEAGAMAMAAEALGLGISSNEVMQNRSLGDRAGLVSCSDLDVDLILPVSGIPLLLSSTSCILMQKENRFLDFLTRAELPLCSAGGGGVTSFMLESLQSAVCRSSGFRNILIASVRRAVRLLSVVEYDGDDCLQHDEKLEEEQDDSKREYSKPNDHEQPDPRLVSFISGLLLSKVTESNMPAEFSQIQCQIAEAWSLGLLSASLPWRMICAFTVAGIINSNPFVLNEIIRSSSTLARYFGRLPSTVLRRAWAERAAIPVCSRYAQSLIELLSAVRRAVTVNADLRDDFTKHWGSYEVDAATPIPLDNTFDSQDVPDQLWLSSEGWVSSDSNWVTWLGQISYDEVKWKAPTRSSVPTLMDSGDGPPFLDVGCTVLRGPDWEKDGCGALEKNEDGKDKYEKERMHSDVEDPLVTDVKNVSIEIDDPDNGQADNPPATCDDVPQTDDQPTTSQSSKDTRKASPRLPVGTILAIEPWNGIPALGRRVRWHLTNTEGVYRFGGDGGRFDICHVEVNKKATRVKKRHPLPETTEQRAFRRGFGLKKTFGIILRLERFPLKTACCIVRGVLEIPAFGAGILVNCSGNDDGSMLLREERLLYGSKDSGWEIRFGQPSYVPGSQYELGIPESLALGPDDGLMSLYEELRGSSSFDVVALRNPENGNRLTIKSEIRLKKPLTAPHNDKKEIRAGTTPFCFDPQCHAGSLALSRDCRTVTCVGSEGRGTAFADVGFTKGVHYWEVKLEQADVGSIFIGVAEKNNGSSTASVFDSSPKLNRWLGWGFVNFRATYTAGAERVYGSHCHSGDTVGVLLDCDAGRLSFFFDGLKYGEHILNDLGCAFENLSPFGFNVDGCGSGGAGQGAPNGFDGGRAGRYPSQGAVRPRSLFPVIGLRNQGDRVTISSKWSTSLGIDGAKLVNNILAVEEVVFLYRQPVSPIIPEWLINEAFLEYQRWSESKFGHFSTRGSGAYRMAITSLDVMLDLSPKSCAAASASLGLDTALLPGDRVRLIRSAGRVLELVEEAIILGSHNGRLYYRIVSQKSEGGSLTEGGGRAWFFDESEVVDGLPHVIPAKGHGVTLPKLDRFKCPSSGGLQVVHESGAVLRSDLEINDGSIILGTIPVGTLLSKDQVTERRVNSCGVVRYRIQHEELGEGWISARIRGGKEEVIVVPVKGESATKSYLTPSECATEWYDTWINEGGSHGSHAQFLIKDIHDFKAELACGIFPGMTTLDSDSLIVSAINAVSNASERGDSLDLSFHDLASALAFALPLLPSELMENALSSNSSLHAAATVLASVRESPKSLRAIMIRAAFLRALNRRIRLALPWLSIRPCQEGSSIFGGLNGHGATIERSGRSRVRATNWTQLPGTAAALRQCKGIIFSSVKREFIQSVTEVTTTPTPLSHDEYELPREIRTVRINRLRAGRTMMGQDNGAKRKYSVFAQLRAETKSWGGAALRRGYVAKGHGGQKRAFKVKLIGEGVNDYSGPYREIFTDAIREASQVDGNGLGSLGVFDATPNNVSDVGENRGLYMFSLNGRIISSEMLRKPPDKLDAIQQSFGILTLPRDEISREVEDSLVFLGRLVGTAFRHGISVDLPLPLCSVWKALTEERCDLTVQMNELDLFAARRLNTDEEHSGSPDLILWQRRLLNPFTEGLSSVLPVELFPLLTGEELRESICGNPDVDVDLLKKVVEIEGFEKDAEVIEFFWETLREMTNNERMQFLQFVWARNRLPLRESDFEAPFKILKDSINQGEKADLALPSASTCFFSLTLPEYSSKEILRSKLLFAITNVTTMETDFQTNSAEISEGYRAF